MARKKKEETLSLFAEEQPAPPTPAYVQRNAERLRRWASKGIFFGSSSWKYPGWTGMVYNRQYSSQRAFEQQCLSEYSEVFPTVCADFALYDFPSPQKMQLIYDQTTDHFSVSLKVTDRITVKRYPKLDRHGERAGAENPDFLNVALFEEAFLRPVEHLKEKRGVIIFEFSTFYPASGVTYPAFLAMIDNFLGRLPKGYAYALELRNREFLTDEYLALLHRHGVAHTLNNWTRMPPILEQIQLGGVITSTFSVARALLKPGRTYQEAVEQFQPYERIQEENPELRTGLVHAVHRCIQEGKKLYAYINNRAEGNSPKTIEGILDILDSYPVEKL